MTPRVAVLLALASTATHETKAVFELVGFCRAHSRERFVSGDEHLDAYDILAVP